AAGAPRTTGFLRRFGERDRPGGSPVLPLRTRSCHVVAISAPVERGDGLPPGAPAGAGGGRSEGRALPEIGCDRVGLARAGRSRRGDRADAGDGGEALLEPRGARVRELGWLPRANALRGP